MTMTDERAPEAPRDDSDVRDVMEASRTEEMVPSSQLRAMGMKAIAARDAATAAMDDLVALAAENARLVAALRLAEAERDSYRASFEHQAGLARDARLRLLRADGEA